MTFLHQLKNLALAQKIKILKENKVYRFTDIILQRGIRWKEDRATILNDRKYSKTILYRYLSNLERPLEVEQPDMRYLHECIIDYSLRNKLKRPKKGFLTLPLRLGDICEEPSRTFKT